MYPAISDFINEVFGTNISLPVQTYGFFVTLAFLLSTWVLFLQLKSKEKAGYLTPTVKKVLKGAPASVKELVILGIISLLIGYKFSGIILDYSTFSENPQDYLLSSKGSWIGGILITLAFVIHRYWDKNRKKLEKPVWENLTVYPRQHAGNILIIAAVAGLIGAKIFHNLENINEFIDDPIDALLSFSGLTFYGGLIFGSLAILYYARKEKINIYHLMDANAPAITIGYAIGRLGCMFSGDGCWGIENTTPKPGWLSWLPDWMWAYDFPHNVVNEGVPLTDCSGKYCHILENPVFPTSLYDFIFMGIIFVLLLLLKNKLRIPGHLFSIFVIIMGIQRFLIEKIRVNTEYIILGKGITQAEIISFILVLLGITGLWYFYTLDKRKKFKDKA